MEEQPKMSSALHIKVLHQIEELRGERCRMELENDWLDRTVFDPVENERLHSLDVIKGFDQKHKEDIEALKIKNKYKDAESVAAALKQMNISKYTPLDEDLSMSCKSILNDEKSP